MGCTHGKITDLLYHQRPLRNRPAKRFPQRAHGVVRQAWRSPEIGNSRRGNYLSALTKDAIKQGTSRSSSQGAAMAPSTPWLPQWWETRRKLGILAARHVQPLSPATSAYRRMLEQAVKCIVAGRVKSVDVGEVNGQIILNNDVLGFIRRWSGCARACRNPDTGSFRRCSGHPSISSCGFHVFIWNCIPTAGSGASAQNARAVYRQ